MKWIYSTLKGTTKYKTTTMIDKLIEIGGSSELAITKAPTLDNLYCGQSIKRLAKLGMDFKKRRLNILELSLVTSSGAIIRIRHLKIPKGRFQTFCTIPPGSTHLCNYTYNELWKNWREAMETQDSWKENLSDIHQCTTLYPYVIQWVASYLLCCWRRHHLFIMFIYLTLHPQQLKPFI